jgi:HD-GYP domain-containing protein (c-di-GMP phosphodiesterase class II)
MRFLHVSSKMLSIDDVYEFPIFLFDPAREQRIVALHPASPVTEELVEQWEMIENKKGYLQIAVEDEDQFIEKTQTVQEEIHKLNEFQIRMFDLWQQRLSEYSDIITQSFSFKDELHQAIEKNDYMSLVQRAKAELLLFPITISKEVSMMTQLAERVFVQDSFITRSVSFAYFFAKRFGVKDQVSLANIVIATLSKDVGQVLINLDDLRDTEAILENKNYLKHPMLSIYLLSKFPVDFGKTTKRIILEHHEQIDGSGFPRGKKESHISILSQIVHLTDYIFKSSMGLIDGNKKDLLQVMKKASRKENLEKNVPNVSESIKDILRTLL